MEKSPFLSSPQERYAILKKYETEFQRNPKKVIDNALRTVPEVGQMPEPIQKVLAQVYAIIPENPSQDVLNRAVRWAFAHISHNRNMIHPDLLENQWERVIRHYLGRNEGQKDVGFYAEIAILENLLLHAFTRLKSEIEYDIHMADCLGDSDFMTDLILIQKLRGKIFQLGIQLTTHKGSPKKKQNFLLKRDLHDKGLHPSPRKPLTGLFLRNNTGIIQVQHFRPSRIVQEMGLRAILGNNPSEMLQTGMLHRAEMQGKHAVLKQENKSKKTPSKEIGRQVFELLQFFHKGILQHTIVPNFRYSHHQNYETNSLGERISGRVFLHGGMPIFEARLTEPLNGGIQEEFRRHQGIQPVIFSIPIPPRFVSEYYKFASQ